MPMSDENVTYMPIEVVGKNHKYRFIGKADGRIFLARGNDAEREGNVSYIGGKYKLIEDSIIWTENITDADIPDREADGIVDDGTDCKVWVVPYKEWLTLAGKALGR